MPFWHPWFIIPSLTKNILLEPNYLRPALPVKRGGVSLSCVFQYSFVPAPIILLLLLNNSLITLLTKESNNCRFAKYNAFSIPFLLGVFQDLMSVNIPLIIFASLSFRTNSSAFLPFSNSSSYSPSLPLHVAEPQCSAH